MRLNIGQNVIQIIGWYNNSELYDKDITKLWYARKSAHQSVTNQWNKVRVLECKQNYLVIIFDYALVCLRQCDYSIVADSKKTNLKFKINGSENCSYLLFSTSWCMKNHQNIIDLVMTDEEIYHYTRYRLLRQVLPLHRFDGWTIILSNILLNKQVLSLSLSLSQCVCVCGVCVIFSNRFMVEQGLLNNYYCIFNAVSFQRYYCSIIKNLLRIKLVLCSIVVFGQWNLGAFPTNNMLLQKNAANS